MNSTSVEITAGLGGFLVLFALALAVWVLGRDLTRRLRRMRLAEEARLQEEGSRAAGPPTDATRTGAPAQERDPLA
jgi:Na+-transporting methylmalonyl-CoA/oxaloacetate decarboxylase gamma subunit